MPAYLTAQVHELLDPPGLQEYMGRVVLVAAQYGGRYIVARFRVELLEGDQAPLGLAVAEFPSAEQFRAFWNSPEYAPLKQIRQRSIRATISLVESSEALSP